MEQIRCIPSGFESSGMCPSVDGGVLSEEIQGDASERGDQTGV